MKGDFLHGFEDGGYMVKDFRLFRNWEWPQAEKYRNRDLDPPAAVKGVLVHRSLEEYPETGELTVWQTCRIYLCENLAKNPAMLYLNFWYLTWWLLGSV